MDMEDALKTLPLKAKANAAAAPPMGGSFAHFESLRAAWDTLHAAGMIPLVEGNTNEGERLKAVCTALLVAQQSAVLNATLPSPEFHSCLSGSAQPRPLQVRCQRARARLTAARTCLGA